jgi:hypothetical protein
MLRLNPFRNRRFVDRRIQGRLIARVGLYWMLYHVLLWHALLVYWYVQFRMMAGVDSTQVSFGEQFGQLAAVYAPVLLCGLLTLPVVLVDMLHVSHRIAGPLVQLGGVLRDLKEGRAVDRVDLRREDLLTKFQQEFNTYLAWLGRSSSPSAAEAENPRSLSGSTTGIDAEIAECRTASPDIPVVVGAADDSPFSLRRPVCST